MTSTDYIPGKDAPTKNIVLHPKVTLLNLEVNGETVQLELTEEHTQQISEAVNQ